MVADGNPETRWDTRRMMIPGDWFEIDLGAVTSLGILRCSHYGFWDDYPRGYAVSTSLDGVNWTDKVSMMTPSIPQGYFDVDLNGVDARYIRITQLGWSGWFWSIGEISLYEPSGEDE